MAPLISRAARTALSYLFTGLVCLAGVLVLQVMFELSNDDVREPTVAALGVATLLAAALQYLAQPPRTSGGASRLKYAALAASLLLGVTLVFVSQRYSVPDSVIVTGVSEWHHKTLADGSIVHLDARTRVKVEYQADARILHLYEGSVVADVAKDSRRPFVVSTPLVDIIAVGTKFGVSIDSSVTTTVSEGIVKVTSRGHIDDPSVVLKAGEELRVLPTQGTSLSQLQPVKVDAERTLEWANGWLSIHGWSVAEGVEEFNRRNRVQIVVEAPHLSRERLFTYARVRVDSPESYAKAVAQITGAHMEIDEQSGVIKLTE